MNEQSVEQGDDIHGQQQPKDHGYEQDSRRGGTTPAGAPVDALQAAAGSSDSAADTRLRELVSEIIGLAPLVSPDAFRQAAQELQGAAGFDQVRGEASPARPRQLLFDEQPDPGSESDAGGAPSIGSRDSSRDSRDGSTSSKSLVSDGDEVPAGAPIWMPNVGMLWPCSARFGGEDPDPGGFGNMVCNGQPQPEAVQQDGASEAGSGDSAPSGSERSSQQGRPRRRRRRGGGRRGSRGSGQGTDLAHGRDMACDVCDLQSGGPQWACMACDMLQQPSIQKIREKHETRLASPRGKASDPDRREARYAMYRGVVRWHWSDPLGAENRVRLPMCVMQRIRRIFPNPACVAGVCDFGVQCERCGHYVGFRTADESRAIREGAYLCR